MVSRLPLYEQVAAPDRIDAWLMRDGQRIPLRIVDAVEVLIEYLPHGAPDPMALLGEKALATVEAIEQIMIAVGRAPAILPPLRNLPQIPTLVAEAPPAADAPPELSDAECAALLARRPWPVADAPRPLTADEQAECEGSGLGLGACLRNSGFWWRVKGESDSACS